MNTTQAICTGQAVVEVSSSIDTCQIEEPRAVVRLGESIYFSARTGSSRYVIMKLGGKFCTLSAIMTGEFEELQLYH